MSKKNIQYLRNFSFSRSFLVALKIKDLSISNILESLMHLCLSLFEIDWIHLSCSPIEKSKHCSKQESTYTVKGINYEHNCIEIITVQHRTLFLRCTWVQTLNHFQCWLNDSKAFQSRAAAFWKPLDNFWLQNDR